jgi:hypothetical protein
LRQRCGKYSAGQGKVASKFRGKVVTKFRGKPECRLPRLFMTSAEQISRQISRQTDQYLVVFLLCKYPKIVTSLLVLKNKKLNGNHLLSPAFKVCCTPFVTVVYLIQVDYN